MSTTNLPQQKANLPLVSTLLNKHFSHASRVIDALTRLHLFAHLVLDVFKHSTVSRATPHTNCSLFVDYPRRMHETSVVSSSDVSTHLNSTLPYRTILTNQLLTQPTRQVTFIGAILVFVFIFVGLVGNLLLITTILSVKKLRTNIINIFIVSVRQQASRFERQTQAHVSFTSIENRTSFFSSHSDGNSRSERTETNFRSQRRLRCVL